ncbi:MAG: ribosomal L7Ae/L30e/S12e/Gadd45 family protein [Eubacteriales bacterium]|nr:ribosomal L7Ae/L30e/S12e/Gadd45 family protein [Eubacteriales bacterium]
MIKENVLKFIGLAKKAGKLREGERACLDSILKMKAKLVLLATDASEGTRTKFIRACYDNEIPTVSYGTKEEIGRYVGKNQTTVIAVTDGSFAGRINEMINPAHEAGLTGNRGGAVNDKNQDI